MSLKRDLIPKKNKFIAVRVTASEHSRIKAEAKKRGFKRVAPFIAWCIFDNVKGNHDGCPK